MKALTKRTKVIVQGITGKMGAAHTQRMLEYGTKIVAGVTPGKGGEKVHGVTIFDTVEEARQASGATASVLFVPPYLALDAGLEAIAAGIRLIIVITEGIPPQDAAKLVHAAKASKVTLIGPNCPGMITPGKSLIGILPGSIFTPGPVGMVSRSGTLTYEMALSLTEAGIGQSTCIGIGGDPIKGTGFIEALAFFQKDPATEVIVLVGEIGGGAEEAAAAFIKANVTKPVIGFIAGQTAPPGKRMGHAGAIISGGQGTAESKLRAFRDNGIAVANTPMEAAALAIGLLKR